jgi:hypothetical protein
MHRKSSPLPGAIVLCHLTIRFVPPLVPCAATQRRPPPCARALFLGTKYARGWLSLFESQLDFYRVSRSESYESYPEALHEPHPIGSTIRQIVAFVPTATAGAWQD